MYFSLSSVLNTIIFSNILIIILHVILKNTKVMISIGIKLIPAFIILTIIRLFLPFEYIFTRNVFYPWWFSEVIAFLRGDFISILSFRLSLWTILQIIWGIGFVMCILKMIKQYVLFSRFVKADGIIITSEYQINKIMNDICKEHKIKNRFCIMEVHFINTPMIYGLIIPHILLPKNLDYKENDMNYILRHEAAHYLHRDLWLKLFLEIICALYWWNPFVLMLKNQGSAVLEMRVDNALLNNQNKGNKTEYLECLIKIAKSGMNNYYESDLAISFCEKSKPLLTKRFELMLSEGNVKENKNSRIIIVGSIVGIYLLSVFFVFEGSCKIVETDLSIITPTEDNAYLIESVDGGYDLYINDMYWDHFKETDKYIPRVKIYKSLGEVYYDKKSY